MASSIPSFHTAPSTSSASCSMDFDDDDVQITGTKFATTSTTSSPIKTTTEKTAAQALFNLSHLDTEVKPLNSPQPLMPAFSSLRASHSPSPIRAPLSPFQPKSPTMSAMTPHFSAAAIAQNQKQLKEELHRLDKELDKLRDDISEEYLSKLYDESFNSPIVKKYPSATNSSSSSSSNHHHTSDYYHHNYLSESEQQLNAIREREREWIKQGLQRNQTFIDFWQERINRYRSDANKYEEALDHDQPASILKKFEYGRNEYLSAKGKIVFFQIKHNMLRSGAFSFDYMECQFVKDWIANPNKFDIYR